MTNKSYLLNCSSEIRNMIYGYVLSFDYPIFRKEPGWTTSILLTLLQVCKSVEQEAAPIFYEQNIFLFNLKNLNPPHRYKYKRIDKGLSPYDDAQMICPIIDVPQRHINSLRNVRLTRDIPGYLPDSSLDDHFKFGALGLGILDLESVINFLSTRNNILKSLSIDLRRLYLCNISQWDPDPSRLLRELDFEKRISTAVGKLANLHRLEVWKSRFTTGWPKSLKVPYEWTAVQPEVLHRVKVDHFPQAKAILYTRRAQGFVPNVCCIAEEFLIDFQQSGVKGRKLEYPSELESGEGQWGMMAWKQGWSDTLWV